MADKYVTDSPLLVTLSAAVMAFSGLPGYAYAQTVDCNTPPLDFGSILACAGGGSVTVTPAGSQSTTGCVSSTGGPFNAGGCFLIGSTVIPSPVILSLTGTGPLSGPGADMSVTSFIVNGGTNNQTTVTVSLAASTVIPFGATLNINPGQTAGTYSGSATVNANFQ